MAEIDGSLIDHFNFIDKGEYILLEIDPYHTRYMYFFRKKDVMRIEYCPGDTSEGEQLYDITIHFRDDFSLPITCIMDKKYIEAFIDSVFSH